MKRDEFGRRVQDPLKVLRCSVCKQVRVLASFLTGDSKRPSRLCRECRSSREELAPSREKARLYNLRYREKNRALLNAKKRDRAREQTQAMGREAKRAFWAARDAELSNSTERN